MITPATSRKGSWIRLNKRRAARAGTLLLLLLLTLPAMVQAQFTFTTNNGAITITGYYGPGGAVAIPSTINGLPVTSIGVGAFEGWSALTSVTIGTNVTSIGDGAFQGCSSLASVTIGNSVTSIGNRAFQGCYSLTSLTIPNSVTSVGDYAFDVCTSLTSVTLGTGVTKLGVEPFYYCTSLSAITVDALNSFYSSVDGVLFNKSQTILIQCPGGKAGAYTIPNGVTNISDAAFEFCNGLTNVTIGNSVTSIGTRAFGYCGGLISLTIGNSVTSIGDGAFAGCGLTSVTIPNSVTSIGDGAFVQCSGLTGITVDALNSAYTSVNGVLFNKSQTTLIQYPAAKGASYAIPNSVTSIGPDAFFQCYGLTNVTIGNSVTSIGEDAFYSCGLTSITFPNSLTNIGVGAFQFCNGLTKVTIGNSVTSIGRYAFFYCTSLTSVTIPNSVTNIADGAFDSCGLTSVTIPNSVTSIADQVFCGCTSLTNVTFPDSVTSIGGLAFRSCTSLTSVTIGNSVTNIGPEAFDECSSLTTVTVGNRVTNIGVEAFYYCTNLTGVYFQGNAPSADSSVFSYDNNATVYYVRGTTGWGTTFGGRPTALWIQVPTIQTSPQTQTAEAGSGVVLGVKASSPLPLFYLWYLNNTNLVSCSTNCELQLTDVQFAQSGAYTVVISNALGAVTSAPVRLNVIAAVERRPVPGVKVMGQTGSLLNVDYANTLSRLPNWTTLGSVSLTSTSQYCVDVTLPLPAQRFYRAWQTTPPSQAPTLDLHIVPAITLTGSIGSSVRLDYINRFGPIDAWVTLDTVTLTNTSQLYFDTSAPGQPQRLYRLVQVP